MTVLPEDPTQAVNEITDIVKELIELTEKELTAHLTKDGVSIVAVQGDKEALTARYEIAAVEFVGRIDTFRTVEKTLLDELDRLQRDLAEKAKKNMEVIPVPVKEERAS